MWCWAADGEPRAPELGTDRSPGRSAPQLIVLNLVWDLPNKLHLEIPYRVS